MLNYLRILRTAWRIRTGVEPAIAVHRNCTTEYHGHADGGWSILANSLGPTSVVVDIGLGEDVEFTWSLMRKYKCAAHGFDPTPRALAYLAKNPRAGFAIYPYGVGAVAGTAQFCLPTNEAHVSGAIAPHGHLKDRAITVELLTVPQIMERIGAKRIDLLKLDIEGAEFDLFASDEFRHACPNIGQICVEFHHRWPEHGTRRTLQAAETLAELGFVCAWRSKVTNEEFLFVRKEILSRIHPLLPSNEPA